MSFRSRIGQAIGRLFSTPYLPWPYPLALSLLIATECGLTLINQPAVWWIDPFQATGSAFTKSVLTNGPILLPSLYLVYIVFVILLVGLLTDRLSLFLWVFIAIHHVEGVMGWIGCGLSRWFQLNENSGACFLYTTGIYTLLAGGIGLLLAGYLTTRPTLAPSRLSRSWVKVPIMAASGLWIIFLMVGVVATSKLPYTGWRPIKADQYPEARFYGATAYDLDRRRAVLFGGTTGWLGQDQWRYENDTWEWDGQDWSRIVPQANPPGRSAHAMAYDESRHVVVLFGGSDQNGAMGDTWEWDGHTWRLACNVCGLPAREGHQLYFDPERGRVVVFGGNDRRGTFFNDAWEWDGQAWSRIEFDNAAPFASGFQLVYDSREGRVVAQLPGSLSATWILQGRLWSQPYFAATPGSRSSTAFIYDPAKDQALLFGGTIDGELPVGDTWIYNGRTWKQIDLPLHPTARWGASAFYDPVRQTVVIFGGYSGSKYLRDMWEYVTLH